MGIARWGLELEDGEQPRVGRKTMQQFKLKILATFKLTSSLAGLEAPTFKKGLQAYVDQSREDAHMAPPSDAASRVTSRGVPLTLGTVSLSTASEVTVPLDLCRSI